MRKLFAAAVLMATALTAGSAAAEASGSYFITNNSSSPVDLASNTLSNNGQVSMPLLIGAQATDYATATQTNGRNVYVGSFIYTNELGNGCLFTTTVIRSNRTGRYSFSFRASSYGSSQSSICTMTATTTNAITGKFSANASMSGF